MTIVVHDYESCLEAHEEKDAEIDDYREMLEMVYNNSFRQPDGMWKILFSDQGRMNLKSLLKRKEG